MLLHLIFLNAPQLERQGTDLQTKIEELQLIRVIDREWQRREISVNHGFGKFCTTSVANNKITWNKRNAIWISKSCYAITVNEENRLRKLLSLLHKSNRETFKLFVKEGVIKNNTNKVLKITFYFIVV